MKHKVLCIALSAIVAIGVVGAAAGCKEVEEDLDTITIVLPL